VQTVSGRRGAQGIGEALDRLASSPLPFRPEHQLSLAFGRHKDPFDRALIAQANIENLMLVTIDVEIPKYSAEFSRTLY